MFSLHWLEAISIKVILTLVRFQFYFVQNTERCKCENNKTALYGHTNTLIIPSMAYTLHDSDLQTVVSDVQLITIESGYKAVSFICLFSWQFPQWISRMMSLGLMILLLAVNGCAQRCLFIVRGLTLLLFT